MIAVMVLLIPFFRRLKLVSIYAYLEMRYGPPVRTAVGLVFLISRSLMTGVGLYAGTIVLSVCPFIHWMWWNAFGFAATAAVAGLASHFSAPPPAAGPPDRPTQGVTPS